MTASARSLFQLLAFANGSLILTGVAFAQLPAPSASAAFPPAAAPAPAPAQPSAPSAAPQPAPAPAPPPAYPPPPGAGYPSAQPPPAAGQQGYPRDPNAPPGYGYAGYPPPPPPQDPDQGFKVPEMSVRLDPFNWLLEGRLGLELESQVYKFLTVEVVPVFVTTGSPPVLNYASYSSVLTQSSNGIGAISGAAIDAGFWFGGKPFKGDMLRVGLTNYSYTYNTSDSGHPIDSVSHTEREFFVMLGQHSRWGAFTIAGGIGLGYELNKQNRCFDQANLPTTTCPKDQLLIKLDNSGNVANLDGFLYPFDLMARFSLGVVF